MPSPSQVASVSAQRFGLLISILVVLSSLPSLLLGSQNAFSVEASVVGIDYGTDWFKVSIVKPGVPLEIVLNRESKRKTAATVAIRDGVRLYGSDAVNTGIRFPQNSYPSLKNLLGKSFDDAVAEHYRSTFSNDMFKDEKRDTCAFRHGESVLTVEELVGMQLAHAKKQAEIHGGEPVAGAVITVPPYFNQFERQALLDAAEIAGLNVFSLISDETAVAMNYAMDRSFAEKEHYVFFDMGAGSTVVTLVAFQNVEVPVFPGSKKNQTVVEIDVKAMGYDATLGGNSFDVKLQQFLAEKFVEQYKGTGKLQSNIFESSKAMAKLLREANRVKQILSANTETFSSVENLIDELDFRTIVSRADLEGLSKDLFERVGGPIDAVLADTKLSLDDVKALVLVGGTVRIPMIQNLLKEKVGEDKIAKSVDGDEAAVLGAGLRAASLSKQFRLARNIIVKDINVNPVEVVYETEAQDDGSSRTIRTMLFNKNSGLGSKKLMNFKRSTDFAFELNYKESSRPVVSVSVSGLTAALEKYQKEGQQLKHKVKAMIELSESAILSVHEAHAYMEVVKDESIGASIKDTVMSFFGGSKKDEAEKDGDGGEEVESNSNFTASDEAANNNITSSGNDKLSDNGKPGTNSTEADKKAEAAKVKTEKVKLDLKIQHKTVAPLDEKVKKEAKQRLAKMDAEDAKRRQREEARNTLEAYVYSSKELLWDDAVEEVTKEEERSSFKDLLDETSDWLYDEGDTATIDVIQAKHRQLKDIRIPIEKRRDEKKKRPEAIKRLEKVLKDTKDMVSSIQKNQTANAEETDKNATDANATAVPPKALHSDEDLQAVLTSVKKVEEWLADKVAAQDKLASHEPPALLVADIEAKMKDLEKEFVSMLMKAAKKPTKKSKSKTASTTTSASTSRATTTPSASKESSTTESTSTTTDSSKPTESAETEKRHDEL
ncbi:hypothetical protein HK102_010077 [Quaeritorhiza haematococci]|nr:hypothetical protein HK102_010077 [Quaeritorhiza haematococci]